MYGYYRKPLDVERWGKMEAWEASAVPYIIGGTEPEYAPDATLTTIGDKVYRAMQSSMVVRELKPIREKEETAPAYFFAFDIIKWAKEKGFDLPQGLEAAVLATAQAYVARHEAAKASLIRQSAFSNDLLDVWRGKDLWSEDEFVALLCGIKPEAFTGNVISANYAIEQAARKAIQRAITAGALSSIWEQEPSKYEWGKIIPPKDVQYFIPAEAIAWAETKRAEFQKFPNFHDHEKAASTPAPLPIPKTLTNTRSASPPVTEYQFSTPNWDHWTRPGTMVYLWEGICLTVNIEPPRHSDGKEICHLAGLKRLPQKFHDAWESLNRDEAFIHLEEVDVAGRMLHMVRLEEFAQWAVRKGFDVPPELREIAAKSALVEPSGAIDEDKDESGAFPWAQTARAIAEEILPNNRKHNILKIAEKVRAEMIRRHDAGMPGTYAGRGGKVPSAVTIKRHALTGLK
jgi:hypothetical protein